jgi:hypothetical protein
VALKTLTRICKDSKGFARRKEGKSIVGQLDEDGYRIEVSGHVG